MVKQNIIKHLNYVNFCWKMFTEHKLYPYIIVKHRHTSSIQEIWLDSILSIIKHCQKFTAGYEILEHRQTCSEMFKVVCWSETNICLPLHYPIPQRLTPRIHIFCVSTKFEQILLQQLKAETANILRIGYVLLLLWVSCLL